jgi:hypothetical protein
MDGRVAWEMNGISRTYKDGEESKNADSFGRDDRYSARASTA